MASPGTCIPYKFVISRTSLSWQEVSYAIQQGFLTPHSAVEHANEIIKSHDVFPDSILELASLNKGDPVHELLEELMASERLLSAECISNKWLYLLLAWIFENRKSYEDALAVVEGIYADFDYPEGIESFVRYMPGESSGAGDGQENLDRLFARWEEYLKNESKKYLKEN